VNAPFGTDTAVKRLYVGLIDRAPRRLAPALRAAGLRARLALASGRRARRRAARRIDRRIDRRIGLRARSATWRRWLATARPPGDGPVVLVDARGHPCAEVASLLAGHSEGPMVVVVDDPDLAPMRDAGLVYELVPPLDVPDPAPPSWAARHALIVLDYGVEVERVLAHPGDA